jgi:hypothetical protein
MSSADAMTSASTPTQGAGSADQEKTEKMEKMEKMGMEEMENMNEPVTRFAAFKFKKDVSKERRAERTGAFLRYVCL